MEELDEILNLQKVVADGVSVDLSGKEETLALEEIKKDIVNKGICPDCATILSDNNDCWECKGCGNTYTITN
jgi:ribosomal protein S27AE